MLRKDVIKGERFRLHEHVRALIVEVKDTARNPQILLSRTDRKFLFRLLEIDVPEIYHGIVEVRSIAREPVQEQKLQFPPLNRVLIRLVLVWYSGKTDSADCQRAA